MKGFENYSKSGLQSKIFKKSDEVFTPSENF